MTIKEKKRPMVNTKINKLYPRGPLALTFLLVAIIVLAISGVAVASHGGDIDVTTAGSTVAHDGALYVQGPLPGSAARILRYWYSLPHGSNGTSTGRSANEAGNWSLLLRLKRSISTLKEPISPTALAILARETVPLYAGTAIEARSAATTNTIISSRRPQPPARPAPTYVICVPCRPTELLWAGILTRLGIISY